MFIYFCFSALLLRTTVRCIYLFSFFFEIHAPNSRQNCRKKDTFFCFTETDRWGRMKASLSRFLKQLHICFGTELVNPVLDVAIPFFFSITKKLIFKSYTTRLRSKYNDQKQ